MGFVDISHTSVASNMITIDKLLSRQLLALEAGPPLEGYSSLNSERLLLIDKAVSFLSCLASATAVQF